MTDEDKPVTALQEQLWQTRVQWQWMRETLQRSPDVLQTEALQRNLKSTQESFLQHGSGVSPEHARYDKTKVKFKLSDRQSLKHEEFLEDSEKESGQQISSLGGGTSQQDVAVSHIKSTLLEFIEILTEAVDYTAQITTGEFLSLRDYAEEIANLKMDDLNLNYISCQEQREQYREETNKDPEIADMSCKRMFEEPMHRSPQCKTGVHIEVQPKNPFVLQSSTGLRPSLRCVQFPPDDFVRRSDPPNKEDKHRLDKDAQNFSSIEVRTQDSTCRAHRNDALTPQKRKLVLVSSETTNMSLHDQKRAHLESNPRSGGNFSAHKMRDKEWCSCSTCVKMAKGEQPLNGFDSGFMSINEICFELERTSRIMVISHREVLSAIHSLRRVPPKKWMTWLESILHFISRSLESCSTFLALCWYTYDMMPNINKCQMKRLLFLMNEYLTNKSSPVIKSDSMADVKSTNTDIAEINRTANGKCSKLNSRSGLLQENENFINRTSKTRTCLDAVRPEMNSTPSGAEKLTPHASKQEIHQENETDLFTLSFSNIQRESKKEDIKTETLHLQSLNEVEADPCPREAHRENIELGQSLIRQPGDNISKMSFFARDALRFRQTHHLGFLFTSAINNVHKMGKNLALILQKLYESSEIDPMLCNAHWSHANGTIFKNDVHLREIEKSKPDLCLHQQEKSHAIRSITKNGNCCNFLREKNYFDQSAHRPAFKRDDQHDMRGTSVRCTSNHGPIRGARNSRHPGFLHRTNRSCSQYQKVQRRSRHHPYFPQGCFLMTESEHWNILRKLSKDETLLPPSVHAGKCVEHGNAEDISTCGQYFTEQIRSSDNSNSSNFPQSSLSESESVMPFDIESSSTTERNNSSLLGKGHSSSAHEQATCLQHTTITSDQGKGYEKTITSTLEMRYKKLKKNKHGESKSREKYEESFHSSTDDSYVQQHLCLHSCRNAQHQLIEMDSDTTEDEYPEPLAWMDSETEQTMSPFCDTLYPPNSWPTLLDEGRGLIEEWQQLLPQLMGGHFLRDIRKMDRPEKQRVDSIILNLLASVGSCLRHVMQEIETHQQLWKFKQENNAYVRTKLETSPEKGGYDDEIAQNTPARYVTNEHFQIKKQLSSPECKQDLSRREASPAHKGVNSEKMYAINCKEMMNGSSIPQHDSCSKSVKSYEICTIHASTPAHEVNCNLSLCDGNPKQTGEATDACRCDAFSVGSTDINATSLNNSRTYGIKNYSNCEESCDEDCFTDTGSPKIDGTSIKNVSAEANMGTSVTPNRTLGTPLTAAPTAAFCTAPGTEEKHALATADALLVSHRRVFLQMLFLGRLEDKNMLRKLTRELCDGLEAALEQSKLLVAARRKYFPAEVTSSNERHSPKPSSAITEQQQRRTEYWQEVISSLFDSSDKTLGIKTVDQDGSHQKGKANNKTEHQKEEHPLSELEKHGNERAAPQATPSLQTLEEKHRESMLSLERAIMDILTFASSTPEVSNDAKGTVNRERLQPKATILDQGSNDANRTDKIPTPMTKLEGTTADSPYNRSNLDQDLVRKSTLHSAPAKELEKNCRTDDQALDEVPTEAGVNLRIEQNTPLMNENDPNLRGRKEEAYTDLKLTIEASEEQENFKRSVPYAHFGEDGFCENRNSIAETVGVHLQSEVNNGKETNCSGFGNGSFLVENVIQPHSEQASQTDGQGVAREERVALSIEQASHLMSYDHASALATAHLLACVLLY